MVDIDTIGPAASTFASSRTRQARSRRRCRDGECRTLAPPRQLRAAAVPQSARSEAGVRASDHRFAHSLRRRQWSLPGGPRRRQRVPERRGVGKQLSGQLFVDDRGAACAPTIDRRQLAPSDRRQPHRAQVVRTSRYEQKPVRRPSRLAPHGRRGVEVCARSPPSVGDHVHERGFGQPRGPVRARKRSVAYAAPASPLTTWASSPPARTVTSSRLSVLNPGLPDRTATSSDTPAPSSPAAPTASTARRRAHRRASNGRARHLVHRP